MKKERNVENLFSNIVLWKSFNENQAYQYKIVKNQIFLEKMREKNWEILVEIFLFANDLERNNSLQLNSQMENLLRWT